MQKDNLQAWQESSYLSGGNAAYIEELYEMYLKNPESVDTHWRNYFDSLPRVNGSIVGDVSHADIRDYFLQMAKQPLLAPTSSADALLENKQARVDRLIDAYRKYGHLAAKLDPLGSSRPQVPELQLDYYGLSKSDFSNSFRTPDYLIKSPAKLEDIFAKLQTIYCNTIGAEYMYIRNQEEVLWLQQRLETAPPNFSAEEKKQILQELTAADGLEKYLSTRYVGQKRFSLEGGDSLIPILQEIVHHGSASGLKTIVMGLAHRGRLNTLINVVGQSPEELFQEFEGRKDYGMTSGDVKYHNGFSSDVKTANGSIHLSMGYNPSHLEIIAPVITGSVRARQDWRDDMNHRSVLAISVHGDAAFSGQGVVMETLNMSQIKGYTVGGTLHIVINNQIGFTTDPENSRSSTYCTDIAKMVDSPVFHVNGDDPEAAVFIAKLALDYRMTFHKDVVIDLLCYRRLGHNEADEPGATQPLMYSKIRSHLTPREVYAERLIAEKIITPDTTKEMFEHYRNLLDKGNRVVATLPNTPASERLADWSPYLGQEWNTIVDTSVSMEKLKSLGKALDNLPGGFEIQRQVGHLMAARSKMATGEAPIDWGYGETLAYASLLTEGTPIRISGQDCGRGTFAHRHAVLHNQNNGECYLPLQHLSDNQAKFEVYDSLLSEEAVMGFEYGYACTNPKSLVIWEAQFGDFANGAQVIVDQFISSAWQKWKRLSGLVLFLPHGYEGQGPEHSSARLERYLQLCAENNIQVCMPSTPAQVFHMLRRQMLRPYRTPLIVMTPKSLLRNKLAVSNLSELANGHFQLILPEMDDIKPKNVRKIIFCAGKVYYDLLTKRREQQQTDTAIIRVEQLYPFPYDEFKAQLQQYSNAQEIVWCQEEPKNQGAWLCTEPRIRECLGKNQVLIYAGRAPSAAPAVGYLALHVKQQTALVADALQ